MNTRHYNQLYTLLPLAAVLLCCSGCFGSRTAENSMSDQEMVQKLQQEVAALRAKLYTRGRGAYLPGPSIQIDGRGSSTTLETLHEMDLTLQETKETLQERNRHIKAQGTQIKELQEANAVQQREKIILEKEKTSKKIAQHALQAAQAKITELEKQLGSSEHKRLDIEKTFAEFATEFLKLRAMDTKQFSDLQRRLRQRLKRFVEEPQEFADANP